DDLWIDVPVEGLFDDADRFFIRNPEAVDKLGFESGLPHSRGNKLPAAVNEHRIDANGFQEHEIPEKAIHDLVLLHRRPAILQYENLAAKPLDVGKGLDEAFGSSLGSQWNAHSYSPRLNRTYSSVRSVVHTVCENSPKERSIFTVNSLLFAMAFSLGQGVGAATPRSTIASSP